MKEHLVYLQDSEYGETLELIKRGDLYALITSNMETGSARNFHCVVRFPKNGEWERLDPETMIDQFHEEASE